MFMTRNRICRSALVLTILLVFVAGAAWGCGGSDEATVTTAALEAGPIEVTDDTGATFVLEQPATRVISLAPSNTEIVCAVGGEPQLIGVTTFCDYPATVQTITKIGTFSEPSSEVIVSLEPDLVLVPGGDVQTDIVEQLKSLNVPIFVVAPENLDELVADIEKVGKLLGKNEEAAGLVASMSNDIETVRSKVASLPTKKVFFEIYSEPLMTAGKGTLIDELVTLAGGVNIGSAAGEGYPQFSEEVLLDQNPEVYIAVAGAQSDPGAISARPGYSALAAVIANRVFVIEDNLVVRDGPRITQGLLKVAAFIHPEAFAGTK
jgi:iron complex transport system substrate-binding protein